MSKVAKGGTRRAGNVGKHVIQRGVSSERSTADWTQRLRKLLQEKAAGDAEITDFALANASAITAAVAGRGPEDVSSDPEAGARMVVNISSANVPAFCHASRNADPIPYKNGYDLGKYRVGDHPGGRKIKIREVVDRALPLEANYKARDVYFGAVELNGAGIRFYGDVCLVLRRDALVSNTIVLDRNSYDLVRDPIRSKIDKEPVRKRSKIRKEEAWSLRGFWGDDLGPMAALKALEALGLRLRRCTTGQISEAVRNDEDYMEVLKINSFGTEHLQEARFSASEAAHDAFTADRLLSGPAPRIESLIWRTRRRQAENELRRNGVLLRVVTSAGRTRV